MLGGPKLQVAESTASLGSSVMVRPGTHRLDVSYRSEYFVPDEFPNDQCYVCYYLTEHQVSFETKLGAEYRLKAEQVGSEDQFAIFAVEIFEEDFPNGSRISTESEQISSRRKCGYSLNDTACGYR